MFFSPTVGFTLRFAAHAAFTPFVACAASWRSSADLLVISRSASTSSLATNVSGE
jgi:hypothetical protein